MKMRTKPIQRTLRNVITKISRRKTAKNKNSNSKIQKVDQKHVATKIETPTIASMCNKEIFIFVDVKRKCATRK